MLLHGIFSIADPPGKPGLIEVWAHDGIADLGKLGIQRPEIKIPLAPDQFDAEVLDGAVDLRDRLGRGVWSFCAWSSSGFAIAAGGF